MTILFNGDSWTWGYNLDDRNDRYAKKISDQLAIPYVDLSTPGCSNRTILRTTLEDNGNYELAIILMTYKNRTEFWSNGKWEYVNMGREGGKKYKDYYVNYYEDEYGEKDEWIVYECLKNYFKVKNIPLLLLTNQKKSDLHYNLNLNIRQVERCNNSLHPSANGHQTIANMIINILQKF